jgi:hypothetical protein
MKNSSKTKPAKISAPAIPAEAGREYRAKALALAHTAALHSKMKGIDRINVGVAFMAEALCLIFEIPLPRAMETVGQLLPLAYGILQPQVTEQHEGQQCQPR